MSIFRIVARAAFLLSSTGQLCAVATLLNAATIAATARAPERLNGSFRDDADIEDYEISADSKWVVYRADQDTDGVRELYVRPVAGSDSARKLNPPLVKG